MLKKMFEEKEEMLFTEFWYLRSLVRDESSPVHPVSESWGGSLSVTYIHSSSSSRTVLLLSNIGFHGSPSELGSYTTLHIRSIRKY